MNTMTQSTTPPYLHDDYSELMSLALDGMLSAADEQRLDQHLLACPSCQAAWTRWQRIGHILTVEPFAGPPQGFALAVDHALQRDETRQERMLASLVLAGGTGAVLALAALGAVLTTALWMAISPAARTQLVETLGFVGQFASLVFQNLMPVRDAVMTLLPSPWVLPALALALTIALAVWVRLVFYGAWARER